MKKPILPALIGSALALSLLACEQTKQLDDMHQSTLEMNQTTSKLSTAASNTVTLMGELYDSARQGASLDIRNKQFQNMLDTTAVDQKLVSAGLYFEAFEFELWSNVGQDAVQDQRLRLAKEAVEELFNHVATVRHWKNIDVFAEPAPLLFNPTDESNQKAVFNVLAAALHKKNRKEVVASKQADMDALSMYDLLANALLAGKQIKEGKARIEDFPEYVDIALRNEPAAIQLLKARYSMLGIVLLGRVTPIADNLWQGLRFKILGKSWDFNMTQMNQSQLKFYRDHLTYAQNTKQLLAELGITVALDKDVKKIFSNMRVIQSNRDKVSATRMKYESDLQNDFTQYLR